MDWREAAGQQHKKQRSRGVNLILRQGEVPTLIFLKVSGCLEIFGGRGNVK